MRGFSFQRLPGTREEVETIRGLLRDEDVDLYTGKEALWKRCLKKVTPRILHLATHGFFLTDQDLSALREEGMERGIQLVRAQGPRAL